MADSQNCDDSRSNINHEATRNDDLEDSPNNNTLDSTGVVNATTSQTLQITSRNVAKSYLSKWASTYELDTFSKNLMLVFIMYDILDEESTYGRTEDVLALMLCFEQRGFDIIVYENKSEQEIRTIFEYLILEDLSDIGCLAVVFLTHSEGNGILLTTNGTIRVGDIIGYLTGLKAPNIITKPKILIFQTSQSCTVIDGQSKNRDGDHGSDIPYEMANETDFLMLDSTYSWMESHKGKNEGSPFIQSFCKFICNSEPGDDIFSIIPHVIEDVSNSYGVPIMTSTLSRKLYFNTRRVIPISDVPAVPLSRHLTAIAEKIMMADKNEKFSSIFIRRRAPSTRPPEAVSIEDNSKKDFRLKYFEYVRDVLKYFVETKRSNCPSVEQAKCLLDIAKTIDCSPSLSLPREQTCIQMVIFLKDQGFNGLSQILVNLNEYEKSEALSRCNQ